MNIKVGRYALRSDGYAMWIEEEYVGKDAKGRDKKQTRRVAGYAGNMEILTRQFCQHKYMNSDAETMRELLKELTQTIADMVELNEAAVKKDFKIVRKTAKERGVK